MTTTTALETLTLGKKYGAQWALQECSISIPAGTVTALVGPNGAGKSTLMHMAVGLSQPSAGEISIFGDSPERDIKAVLSHIGFVAQDHPLYKRFTVADMLTFGRKLNANWDDDFAAARLNRLGIPLNRPTGKLSGGQQAQVALVLALAKKPELIILDEPLASLDPLARREFLQTLMEEVAANGLTVLLSSHNLSDPERVCDHLVLLVGGRVQVVGDIERIVAVHKRLTGPRCDPDTLAAHSDIVIADHTPRQSTLLVRANGHVYDPSWTIHDASLEEIVLAYLGRPPVATPFVLEEPRVEIAV
ncbi:MAG: ABC transporter ATP-binding protein [Thermomicrobiales bacterium]